ncbi:MAG: hypothetical protein GPJ54_10715 [Candidatus Heimdallarchaeota archaeon]|nr:hypothetical protein [Candidatus Heimdallarchaeota archaeon]
MTHKSLKLLNYKVVSFFISITLLIIVSSGNTNSATGSDLSSQKLHTTTQANLASVSIGSHSMNDEDPTFDSIRTNAFEPYWVEKSPTLSPSARQHHAMTYDSVNDKIILFGGYNGSALNDTWVYDYSTNSWEEMKPSAAPAPMYGHAMVYEPAIQKVVMFGGIQTWTYDYLTNVWEQQFPQVSPSTKTYHSLIYDTTRSKIMLLGGNIGAFETWEMDAITFNWTNLFPVTPLPQLFAFAASYDQVNDKIILFGGQTIGVVNAGDTYAYDYPSNEWTLLAPLTDPSNRRFYGRPMEYDIHEQKSVFFGGYTDAGNSDEVWTFDYSSSSWELIPTLNSPSTRWIHTMVYSSSANKFIMFGGTDGAYSDQTLELTIYDSDPPVFVSPGEKFVELGSASNSISWQILDPSDGNYEIRLDNIIVDTGNFVNGQTISLVPFGLGVGDYVLKMTATDLRGNSASDTIILHVVEVDPPIIIGPEDIIIENFNDLNNITWVVEDLTPASYNVTQNGTIIAEGDWQNGDQVVVDLNSLPLGNYIFEITVTDAFGNVASDIVLVTILDNGLPTISNPSDIDMIQGDLNKEIIWYLSDNDPTFYVLEVNQQVTVNNSWIALPFVSEKLDNYIPGNYNFTLTLYDASGNIVSDTVIVKIYVRQTNTQTPTSGGGGGGGTFGSIPSIPPEVAVGAGVLAGGTLFFAIIRRIRGGGGY